MRKSGNEGSGAACRHGVLRHCQDRLNDGQSASRMLRPDQRSTSWLNRAEEKPAWWKPAGRARSGDSATRTPRRRAAGFASGSSERPRHPVRELPAAVPGVLDPAAVEPVAAQAEAELGVPLAADGQRGLGVGIAPPVRGERLWSGPAQPGEGVQPFRRDAFRILFQVRFAPFRGGVQQPGFRAAAPRFAAVARSPAGIERIVLRRLPAVPLGGSLRLVDGAAPLPSMRAQDADIGLSVRQPEFAAFARTARRTRSMCSRRV